MNKGRPRTTKDFPRVNLRMPPALYEHILASATNNLRSINSEITLRLMQTVSQEEKVYEPVE